MIARGELVWRGIALAGLAAGVAALALHFAGGTSDRPAPAAMPAPQRAIPALAGRSATLSRILPDRRAVARVALTFGARGALDVACRAEAADGAVFACFGEENGAGTWSVEGTRLCVAAPVLGLAAPHCYEVGGEPPALTLAGPGFLAGNMQLR